MLLSRTQILLVATVSILLISHGSIAGSIAELKPSLIAVTITDFEVGESHDFHSAYWAYDAQVETAIAGPKYKGKITFVVAKATDLQRVFPAQYVLVFEGDDDYIKKRFGTVVEAIVMQNAEDIVCFPLDLATVFPDDARFSDGVADSESLNGHCYESSILLEEAFP